jgi:hypothetical protein
MATIRTSLTVAAPGGQSLTAVVNKEANSTIDREIAVRSGEFVEVFTLDTQADTAAGLSNALPDYKQLIAYNSGKTPLEICLKTNLINQADGLTHANVFAYPTFFIPVGGYLSLPSPRIVSTSGTPSAPQALNYVGDIANRVIDKVDAATNDLKRLLSSTATYESPDGKTLKYGLSADAITNSQGDIYFDELKDLDSAVYSAPTGGNDGKTYTTDGLVPGSLRVMFYKPGFSEFNYTANGLKPQTSANSSLLALNTAYAFGLTVDGAGGSDVSFTTDTTNVLWGTPLSGTGVLAKIQAAMDAAEKECDVALVNGKLRFTSRSRTTSAATVSSVLLGAPGAGTDFRTSGINATGYVEQHAVEIADGNDDDIMFDDGEGNLSRANGGSGWCEYGLPGAGSASVARMYITGAPANSSVLVSWLRGSTSGGDLSSQVPDSATENDNCNAVMGVYARALSWSRAFGASGRKGKLRLIVVDNESSLQSNY